jgi:hypothetical protein
LVIPETERGEMNLTKRLLIVLILGVPLLLAVRGWPDGDSLQKINELNQEATRLRQQGQYTRAIPLVERILANDEDPLRP